PSPPSAAGAASLLVAVERAVAHLTLVVLGQRGGDRRDLGSDPCPGLHAPAARLGEARAGGAGSRGRTAAARDQSRRCPHMGRVIPGTILTRLRKPQSQGIPNSGFRIPEFDACV